MNERNGGVLSEPYATTYNQLSKENRRTGTGKLNLAVSFDASVSPIDRESEVKRLQESGYSPISIRYILGGVAYLATQEGLELPYQECATVQDANGLDKKTRKEVASAQNTYIETLLGRVTIENDSQTHTNKIILVQDNGSVQDITSEVEKYLTDTDDLVETHYNNRICLGKTIAKIKSFIEQNDGIVAVYDSSVKNPQGPSIQVSTMPEASDSRSKHADQVVSAETENTRHFGVLRETVRHAKLQARRETLQEQIDSGEIKLVEAFTREEWPSHPLMSRIKTQTAPIIADVVGKAGILCDEQDIRYQTLFRLTTFGPENLFHHGDQLFEELQQAGAYDSWLNIPKVSEMMLEQYSIKKELIRRIAMEQLAIITNRLKKSDLPINDILTPSGIFAEEDWRVVKSQSEILATNKATGAVKPVSFRQIDNDIATSFHRDLHYIHTPRSGTSFGLFLENQEIPFSVLAIEPIDRKYKQNILLALGYDPDHCIDFTRLYSRPGAPFNTSSAIFACAFQHLEQNNPDIQAALSAFMPSYATGLSMISGGFDNPVMVKDGRQKFQQTEVDGQQVWEHLTTRRQSEGETLRSVLPMFPTVELLRPITQPRFEPLKGTKGKMFEI